MDFFTREWQKYIYQEWGDYTNWGGFFKQCDYNKNKVEIYNGDYEVKLLEEFKKYYLAKKKYVEMTNELFLKFGDYENIEIKSVQEELDEYKKRVEFHANKLHNHFIQVAYENELKGLEEIDYKLLLLGYISKKNYNKLPKYYFNDEFPSYQKFKIFNFANVFLSGRVDYEEYLKNFIQKEVVEWDFHDCYILEINKEEKKLSILLSSPYSNVGPQYLTFVNYQINIELDNGWIDAMVYSNDIIYKANKIYYYLEFVDGTIIEILCDDIEMKDMFSC